MMEKIENPPWAGRLNLKRAADFLGMGKSTLEKRMADGSGPRGEKFLDRWEFEIPELVRWRQCQARKV